MKSSEIEIFVGDVNDVEARVFARYLCDSTQGVVMRGTLRGPYCDGTRTLPAHVAFRDLGPQQPGLAEAMVPDPCVWSPELPHLYHADVEVKDGSRVLAEFHGTIGLRRGRNG